MASLLTRLFRTIIFETTWEIPLVYRLQSFLVSQTGESCKFPVLLIRVHLFPYGNMENNLSAFLAALLHTLNNTVAAPPRMLIAFLENNLQADGSIKIPTVLQPYMGGKTEIR